MKSYSNILLTVQFQTTDSIITYTTIEHKIFIVIG